ncbi:hypothetical protein TNCV_3832061 [Trichonephila clavipes]|nr:hypothetical protein TNCV_3832061 [Trichonephila clavipes]
MSRLKRSSVGVEVRRGGTATDVNLATFCSSTPNKSTTRTQKALLAVIQGKVQHFHFPLRMIRGLYGRSPVIDSPFTLWQSFPLKPSIIPSLQIVASVASETTSVVLKLVMDSSLAKRSTGA